MISEKVIDKIVDIIIYACGITLILFGLLKGFGVINTPALINQLPLITAGLGLLGFAYKIGKFVDGVNLKFVHLDNDANQLKSDVSILKSDAMVLKSDVVVLKSDVNFIKQKLQS